LRRKEENGGQGGWRGEGKENIIGKEKGGKGL